MITSKISLPLPGLRKRIAGLDPSCPQHLYPAAVFLLPGVVGQDFIFQNGELLHNSVDSVALGNY